MRYLALWFCLFIAAAGQAQAEKRVALVIGNSAYQNTAELKNPRNDATDFGASLMRLGFEVVEGRDLDKRSMERVVRQFGIKLEGADLALFFYAGHGLQVGGQNYLVPIDARLVSEGDVDFETIPLNLVLKQMEREAKTSLILLDACRDNPLSRNLARNMGTRSSQIGQGLAEVKTGIGTLIGFSTQPGAVALDGTGRNSPYTAALLTHAESQGKDVSSILVSVRNDVLKATGGRQVPWEHTSLTGNVFLKAGPAVASAASSTSAYDKDLELTFWNSVRDSKSPALLETYLERYPNGTFAGLARAMIGELKQAQTPGTADMKVAALPQQTDDSQRTSPTDRQALVKAVQTELKRVGCLDGAVDGQWGSQSQDALDRFARFAKVSLATEEPTQAALEAVSARKERICPVRCDDDEKLVGGKCVARNPAVKARRQVERSDKGASSKKASQAKEKKGTMCWGYTGRVLELVPCDDSRAQYKAY